MKLWEALVIVIKRVKRLDGSVHDVTIESQETREIDAKGELIMLPAFIDPNPRLGPGWVQASIKNGVGTVFIPETQEKIPLRTYFYGESFSKKKNIAYKTSMKRPDIEDIFRNAAQHNIILALQHDLERAIALSERYKTEIIVLDVHSKEELDLIRKAKERELLIYAEISDLSNINDDTVDFIGSPDIKKLLAAYREKKITLEKIVQLTHLNIENIFGLPRNSDAVLLDLKLGSVYTIIQGKVFSSE